MTRHAMQTLAALACLFATVFCLTVQAQSQDVRLQLDLRKPVGFVPYAYRAGVFLNSLPDGYPKRMFLADQRPGMVEFSWDYYRPLLHAETEAEFFARLPESTLTAWVRETAAAGGEPYIRLMPVPRWLWSGRPGFRKPPGDWLGWERFVQRLVDYFNNQLKIDVRYVVWDEPDGFWEGSTEDYLRLYKHAAAGLLRANPKARIGGPATAAFDASIGRGNPPLLPDLVRFCAETALPGLAKRLPLDILVWHSFSAAPISPGQYDFEVREARALLRQHGYGDSVEINVGSWTALGQYPGVPNARDTEFLGAFIVSSVIAMQRAGVDRHAFFNLFEDWRTNRQEFSDDMGLTTMKYVAKAGYHAYRLLGRLQGEHFPLSISDPFVQAAAARDDRTVRIVVSNFAPPGKMLMVHTVKQLVAGGRSREEIRRMIPNLKDMAQLVQDRSRIENWNVPADVRGAFLKLNDSARLATQRQREPLAIEITVDGLAGGRYRLREFRVDANSGNAFRQRENSESMARQGRAEEVNATTGEALSRPRESMFEVQTTGGGAYAWRTSLPPYGVILLEAELLR